MNGMLSPCFTQQRLENSPVRWDPMLWAFVMMYMSGPDDPIGAAVVMPEPQAVGSLVEPAHGV